MKGVSLSVAIVMIAVLLVIVTLIIGSKRFLLLLSYTLLSSNHVFLGNALSLSFTLAALSTGDFVYSSIWQPFYLETLNVSPDFVSLGSPYFGSGTFSTNISGVNKTIGVSAPFGLFDILIARKDIIGTAILNSTGSAWVIKGKSLKRAEYGSVSSQVILDYLYRAYETASSKKIDVGGAYVDVVCMGDSVMINGETYKLYGFNCSGGVTGYVSTIFIDYKSTGNKVTLTLREKVE